MIAPPKAPASPSPLLSTDDHHNPAEPPRETWTIRGKVDLAAAFPLQGPPLGRLEARYV
jgi:hypothetical protein